ncbi:hypothetical protein [Pseudomonas sp.]|uniref:hypothetical protein n=1 Tax=Pseudomonas sp. TaxID=306 RepID=UPI0026275543|nr:hypothetical protein [Pseudomonas sp.]
MLRPATLDQDPATVPAMSRVLRPATLNQGPATVPAVNQVLRPATLDQDPATVPAVNRVLRPATLNQGPDTGEKETINTLLSKYLFLAAPPETWLQHGHVTPHFKENMNHGRQLSAQHRFTAQ